MLSQAAHSAVIHYSNNKRLDSEVRCSSSESNYWRLRATKRMADAREEKQLRYKERHPETKCECRSAATQSIPQDPAKIRIENWKTSENILKDEVIPIAELPALRGLVTLNID